LLLVASASELDSPIAPELLAWLREAADRVRRIGSVCSGAFALAAAGILDGRRATTHWNLADKLAQRYPRVSVDADKIFIQDGNVWTNAGVSTGADLALAMVEEDHGHELAIEVARHMVLFLRRPGGQSQFSSRLAAQAADRQPIRELIAWISENLDADLSVPVLAKHAGMSDRNFSRVFSRQVGATPARFVSRLRLQAAKARLEQTTDKVGTIASRSGFGDAEALRRQLRSEGATPRLYRSSIGLQTPQGAALRSVPNGNSEF
jgi:transcriptional regulator GlxA family with amidase domain